MFSSALCFAGARRFNYVYEATTSPPGSFEFENWVTLKARKPNDNDFRRLEFRHEIEWGVTDRLQAAVYIADWFNEKDEGSKYTNSAVEVIYNLTNPVTSQIGSAVYGELKVGDDLVELEGKLLLQKNIGPWVLAYNATLEAVWEGEDLEEREGEIQQTAGISYEINPNISVGAELLHEIELPDWSDSGRPFLFGGPNVSLRFGKWWATVTGLAQLTDAGDEPDVQVRAIVGYSF